MIPDLIPQGTEKQAALPKMRIFGVGLVSVVAISLCLNTESPLETSVLIKSLHIFLGSISVQHLESKI